MSDDHKRPRLAIDGVQGVHLDTIMDFFSNTYNALKEQAGTLQAGPIQTTSDTIKRLSSRLSPATLLADRRAAVLALRGLSRDCTAEVGENALSGLLQVVENDAEIDADIGKAALETLNTLCKVGDGCSKELAFKHSDAILANEKIVHKLFALVADGSFYVRLPTLQFLSTLLQNRQSLVQTYFLTTPSGPGGILATLEDKREVIRNGMCPHLRLLAVSHAKPAEALEVIQALLAQSPDIQKLLAFEGAFEKLFDIIKKEDGIEGGAVVQECLICCDGLLRFNTSNQTFFHETGLTGFLTYLLLFPSNLPFHEPAPQQFALQFWDSQKTTNAHVILAILGMLVASKASNVRE